MVCIRREEGGHHRPRLEEWGPTVKGGWPLSRVRVPSVPGPSKQESELPGDSYSPQQNGVSKWDLRPSLRAAFCYKPPAASGPVPRPPAVCRHKDTVSELLGVLMSACCRARDPGKKILKILICVFLSLWGRSFTWGSVARKGRAATLSTVVGP